MVVPGVLRHSFVRLALAPLVLTAAVPLRYFTDLPPGGHGEMDSVALWIAPDGSDATLFVTDKTWDCVEMHDADTNVYIGRLGSSGPALGQLDRPNAVAVAKNVVLGMQTLDVLFVVERDNSRVSAFALPGLNAIGSFGAPHLVQPMGLAIERDGGATRVWVTDLGLAPNRVFVFTVTELGGGGLSGTLDRSFPALGATLESILVDSVHGRVFLCDEGAARDVMVYDLQGTLLTRFGNGRFVDDPEGIVLFDRGGGAGYLIVSDQNAMPVEFEVFDRQTLGWLTSFSGPTQGTDGIALTQTPLPGFGAGAFFAVHADDRVHAYDWADIAAVTGLCLDAACGTTDTGADATATVPLPRLGSAPNPFNPSTTLRFELVRPSAVALRVFDLRGRAVADLGTGLRAAGAHTVTWDGTSGGGDALPSGVYVARLQVGTAVTTHKLTLVR